MINVKINTTNLKESRSQNRYLNSYSTFLTRKIIKHIKQFRLGYISRNKIAIKISDKIKEILNVEDIFLFFSKDDDERAISGSYNLDDKTLNIYIVGNKIVKQDLSDYFQRLDGIVRHELEHAQQLRKKRNFEDFDFIIKEIESSKLSTHDKRELLYFFKRTEQKAYVVQLVKWQKYYKNEFSIVQIIKKFIDKVRFSLDDYVLAHKYVNKLHSFMIIEYLKRFNNSPEKEELINTLTRINSLSN